MVDSPENIFRKAKILLPTPTFPSVELLLRTVTNCESMVDPTMSELVVLIFPPISIAPSVENRPKWRVDVLRFRPKPTVFVTASVLIIVEPFITRFLALRFLPTSRSNCIATDEKTDKPPLI